MKINMLTKTSLILITLICFSPAIWAGPINAGDWLKLTQYNPNGNGGIMVYDISHTNNGPVLFTLSTFCIQDNTYITQNTWYQIKTITDQVGPFNPGHPGEGTLKPVVDYLYYRFWTGQYDVAFSNPSTGKSSQADFQKLLWSLQGSGPFYAPVAGTQWKNDLDAWNNSANGLQHPWGTLVLNIVDSSGQNDVQNQLYHPVPEPSTVLLLGIALAAVAFAVKKM
jgi:hypothetical protein